MRSGAKALRISHSTVSRRFDALEEAVGGPLAERRSDGFALTAAGLELLPIARAMAIQAHTFGRRAQAFDQGLDGTLRVTLPEVIATHLLADHLFDFMSMYPGIRLEILASTRPFDLTKREADVAVRFTKSPPGHLVGQRLGVVYQAAYCLPSYRAQHDPLTPSGGARWIGFGDEAQQAAWIKRSPFPWLPSAGRFDDLVLQVEAARAGQGIACIPCFLGDRAEELHRISRAEPMADLWLLFHPDLRGTAKVKALRSLLVSRRTEIARDLGGQPMELSDNSE